MKRTKLLLSMLASLLLAFVMVFAAACDSNKGKTGSVRPAPEVQEKPAGDLGITDGGDDETLSLLGIEITGLPKDEYKLGEPFESGGLQVRATYLDSTVEPDPLDPDANLSYDFLNESDYSIDSNDFDNTRVGVYTIYVSYAYLGVTRTASYPVTVLGTDPAYGGIVVKLKGNAGTADTFTLSADNTSATVTKDILEVYAIGTNGEPEASPLAGDKYNVQLYLGSKEIENNEATENGVYSLVASLVEDETKQDFIPVYVANPVSKIECIKTVGKFTQAVGNKDTMSSTWQFTVTYANNVTKTVKSGSAGLTIGTLDVGSAGSKSVTATYVEKDASGASHTITCNVDYEITDGEVVAAATIVFDGLAGSSDITVTSETPVTISGLPSYVYDLKLLATTEEKQSLTIRSTSTKVNGTSHNGIRTGGASGKGYRNVAFTLDEGTYDIVVYGRSSSKDGSLRYVQYWTEESETAIKATNAVPQSDVSDVTDEHAITFAAVSGGTTFYFGSDTNLDILMIVIIPV